MYNYLKSLWYSLLNTLGIYKFEKRTFEYVEDVTEVVDETITKVNEYADKEIKEVNKAFRNGKKLTCSEVVEITRAHNNDGLSNKELARKHGISASTVSRIVTGKTYKHCF